MLSPVFSCFLNYQYSDKRTENYLAILIVHMNKVKSLTYYYLKSHEFLT